MYMYVYIYIYIYACIYIYIYIYIYILWYEHNFRIALSRASLVSSKNDPFSGHVSFV